MQLFACLLIVLSRLLLAEEAVKPPSPPPEEEIQPIKPAKTKKSAKVEKTAAAVQKQEEPKQEEARKPRLVRPFIAGESGYFSKEIIFEVSQIIDDSNMIAKQGPETIWIKNVNTKGIIDGHSITMNPDQFFKIGTQRYKTVLGATKTIWLAEAINEKP